MTLLVKTDHMTSSSYAENKLYRSNIAADTVQVDINNVWPTLFL